MSISAVIDVTECRRLRWHVKTDQSIASVAGCCSDPFPLPIQRASYLPTARKSDKPLTRITASHWRRELMILNRVQVQQHLQGRPIQPAGDVVLISLPLLACRFLGQSFGGSSSCPHRRRFCRLRSAGKRQAPVRTPAMKSNPLESEVFRV